MEGAQEEDWRPLALPGAILLAAIILSGAMLYSASNITGQIYGLETALKAWKPVNGGSGGATPTPVVMPTQQGTPTGGLANIDTTGRPFKGPANAPVTIIEFSDFQCPYCSRGATTIAQLMTEFPTQIKLVYMAFPLGFHENAQKAAEAYECAAAQGKAYEMHDKMFANQGTLAVANLKSYAAELGMDATAFNSCLDNGEKAATVAAQAAVGSQNGVDGTPSFFINGKLVVGAQPIDVFRTEVNAALATG